MRLAVNNNGFTPKLWGPGTWNLMHMVAMVYPMEPTRAQMDETAAFYTSLASVLPCPTCREHYRAMISSGPLRLTRAQLSSRPALFSWTVAIHDAVNARLGKRHPRRSVGEWYKVYDKMR